MELSLGFVIEIVNNLFQAFYLVGFLYLFFEKKSSKLFNIISYCTTTLLLFMISNYYTYHELTFSHSDVVFFIIVLILYSLICLKGKILLRIIMPLVDFLITTVCNYAVFGLFSLSGKRPFVEALTFSNAYRYLFMIVGHATTLFVCWLVLRFSKKRIRINSAYEAIVFIVVPITSLAGVISVIITYEHTDFDPSILTYVLIIMAVLVINTVVFWIIVDKISKDNNIKTELLLSNQREEMYKASVLQTSEQLNKTSKIKHDMKNQLDAIHRLIKNEQYENALQLCDAVNVDVANVHTTISTDNPTLNAILNVEINKAIEANVSFTYDISDSLSFVSSSDIVSIIGNLCDNAIEYLTNNDLNTKRIFLDIFVRNDYHFITCKNTIGSSVLETNPELESTKKDDTEIHGKGIAILKDIVKKYQGEIGISEENELFNVIIMIRDI